MNSQNIKPGDLVIVIYLPNTTYLGAAGPGSVGTIVGRVDPRQVHPAGSPNTIYWRVEFPNGFFAVSERVLRKIDGEGRQVGRWDFCVFNAPKRYREIKRQRVRA